MYWPADYLIDSTRPGPLRGHRRGRLRQDRGGDPLACSPRPARAALGAGRAAAGRRRAVARRPRPRRTSARRARRAGSPASRSPAATTYPGAEGDARAQRRSPTAASGRSAGRRPPPGAGATIDAAGAGPSTSTSCSARPGGRRGTVQVLLDGRPVTARQAGADVHGGRATVTGQRLYTLVSLPRDERHHLTLRFAPGHLRVRVHVRLTPCRRGLRGARIGHGERGRRPGDRAVPPGDGGALRPTARPASA